MLSHKEQINDENNFSTNSCKKLVAKLSFSDVACLRLPPGVFYKKNVFLKISQNSQKKTCARFTKSLWHRCFPVNFNKDITKFLRTFFTEHLWATASRFSFKDDPSKTSDESST